MLINEAEETAYVTEIKTQSSISGYLFPSEGNPRDVAKEIIDFYFPETIANHKKPLYYFGAEQIFKLFNKNQIQSYSVPVVPRGKLKTVRYELSGITNLIEFSIWVQEKILLLNLNGFIECKLNKKLDFVSGASDAVEEFIIYLIEVADDKSKDFTLEESVWDGPIKIGFEVHISKSKKKSTNKEIQYNI